MAQYIFPPGFLWGSGTSAFQVEGLCTNHDFYEWSVKGRVKDNSNPAESVFHYIKYKEDIQLLKELCHNTARIGLEWARIEPQEGCFDITALEHYRDELIYMRQNGMAPMVTLHHFANPLWFSKKEGWENKESTSLFLRYVEKSVEFLGDLIDYYIVINEPTVLAYNGYFTGEFPPGKKNFLLMQSINNTLAKAHSLAYETIHSIHEMKGWHEACVGVAKHMRSFAPYRKNSILDRLSTKYINQFFNYNFLDKVIKPGGFNNKLCALDFIGINYYSGDLIKFPFDMLKRQGFQKNILGWDIYPQGLYTSIMDIWNKYKMPIFITENGVCDLNDEIRGGFLKDHIRELHRAIEKGADVKGYYHWSSLDNFELSEGISIRFGLIHVDHNSPERTRTIKGSGRLYSEIIKNNGLIE